MNRRRFLSAAAAGAYVATNAEASGPIEGEEAQKSPAASDGVPFKLDYAPHFGMFRHHAGDDPIDQIQFMHDRGFRSMEDNGMRHRPVETQIKIGAELERLGMRMGVFVANTNGFGVASLSSGDESQRALFLENIRESVEIAKRCGAKWCTVVPGEVDPRLQFDYQTANVIETLRQAAEICEPSGLVMVLEPLNWFRDHPKMFLSQTPHAHLICRAVNSPSCKILFDIYHQQISEGNLIPNIDRAWGEIAYFQIGDNPGRQEPTTGEINFRNVFRHLAGRNYGGILGMEHGNSKPGKEGEQRVIDAYRESDDF